MHPLRMWYSTYISITLAGSPAEVPDDRTSNDSESDDGESHNKVSPCPRHDTVNMICKECLPHKDEEHKADMYTYPHAHRQPCRQFCTAHIYGPEASS